VLDGLAARDKMPWRNFGIEFWVHSSTLSNAGWESGDIRMSEDRYGSTPLFDQAAAQRAIKKPSTSSPVSDEHSGLITAAWITAFLFPLVGFILGIILTAKNRVSHGVGTMIVSVVWVLFLMLVIS